MKFYSLAFAIFLLLPNYLTAQDNSPDDQLVQISIPEVALLDLESATSTSINLTLGVPLEAGTSIDFSEAVDSTIWINYSSVVGTSSEPNRKIYAQIVSGQLPSGIRMRLTVSDYSGNGKGYLGVPTSSKIINYNSRAVIRNIRSCFTGNGPNNGHKLIYSLEKKPGVNAYSKIDFDESTTITVMYTISND